jgi:hypothetical protein
MPSREEDLGMASLVDPAPWGGSREKTVCEAETVLIEIQRLEN